MGDSTRNIYDQQSANRRTTIVVMIGFVLLVAFLGFGFDAFILGTVPLDAGTAAPFFPIGTGAAILLSSVVAVNGLRTGDRSILASSGAMPVSDSDPAYQQLINVRDEMAIAAGLPRPALYVIRDDDPNAFATGRDPEHASIAVTKGLTERLNREELQAVVAHEMSHIRNFDIRLMTLVAALIGSVALLTEWGLRATRFGATRKGGSSKRSGGGGAILLLLWVVALVLAPLVSRLLAMCVSRQREYLADASAAELTRNPLALASALSKIDTAEEPTRTIKKGTAHLCIADPLGREANDREGIIADLFATHPPIEKRILLLKAMAYQK